MRILILADVPPYVIGGAEIQSWRLALAWAKSGHEVEIAGHRIPNTVREGIRLHRLPVLKSAGRALRGLTYFLSLAWFLVARSRGRVDVIYCRFLGEAALSVALLKQWRLVGARLVAVPAASGNEGNADLALLRGLPFTAKLIALLNRQCDCVNYIAPGIERTLADAGLVPRHLTTIPNGIDISSVSEIKHKPPGRELLFVGRLVPQKGLDWLLPVLTRLRERGQAFHFTLIGDGPLRGKLEQQTRELGLAEHLSFLGAQPQAVVQEKLAAARAFVLPSRYEGLSNAALEALAQGVPCLLSRCGGVDAYLSEETGWVFDGEDSAALENALVQVLEIPARSWSTMSNACRTLAADRFSLDKVAGAYLEIFEAL